MDDVLANDEPAAPVQRLSLLQFAACLSAALLMFAFITGPVWTHPWDINNLDVAIWYSYIPIPLMVAACLAYKRAFNWRGLFLDTLILVLVKYSLTFSFALALWAVAPKEPDLLAARGARLRAPALVDPAPPPSVIDPAQTGSIAGLVSDASGKPVAGAVVYIESGLEGYAFKAPEEPLSLENGGLGVTPKVSVARLRQPVQARSTDGHLHTFVATKVGGAALLNAPLIPSGVWSPVNLREAGFVAEVQCSVHQRLGTEAPAYLVVLDHPFSVIAGADGRYQLAGVPSGALRVAAFHPDLGAGSAEARVNPGAAAEVAIALRGK